ncbi:MAG: 50S ribosomal protein L30 [Candidatus Ranarchaeia archaeon]
MTAQLIVIRIRGTNKTIMDISRTLSQLRLNKVNHATLVDDRPSYLGMLQRAKDYIAWGPITKDILVKLLEKRGRPCSYGDKVISASRLTDSLIKEHTPYSNISQLADALLKGEIKITDVPCIKPIFRLHPPKGGHKGSVKRPFKNKGVVGNQGSHINKLLEIMI